MASQGDTRDTCPPELARSAVAVLDTYGQAVADIPAGSSVTRQWVTANEWDVTMSNRNIVYGKNSNEFRDQMFQFGQAVVNGQACAISGNKYHPKYSSTRIDFFEDIYTLDPPISGSAGHNLMNTYSSRFRGFKPGVATTMQSYSLCPVKSGYWAWFQDRGLCNNNGTIKWVGPKY